MKQLFHFILRLAATGMITSAAQAQYLWTNFAGQPGSSGSTNGTGTAARFSDIRTLVVDGAGNIYVADTTNQTIRKITPLGAVTTLAGLAGSSGSADGIGSQARFSFPKGVAVDSSNNIYVGDTSNATIRKITSSGMVTTLAGSAGLLGSVDGTGAAASFNTPYGIAVNSVGNLYVGDLGNYTIRKVTAAGAVTTLAGLAGVSGSVDGVGNAARFTYTYGVALDSTGNIYVGDVTSCLIRKVTPAGSVATLAGMANSHGSTDGSGGNARFNDPSGVAVDAAGNVYVADKSSHTIRKITSSGVVTTIGGLAGNSGSADGLGSAARFANPRGVAVDSGGNIYVSDTDNFRITKGILERVMHFC